MIKRYLQKIIENSLNKGKIVILYGPRQVGKTTLAQTFMSDTTILYNCDRGETRNAFETTNLTALYSLVEPYERVIIDEAQRVRDIGLTLKILIDTYPKKQFLVTGSSSLDLANRVVEPLTGRHFSFLMYPLSLSELQNECDPIALREQLAERLIYGSYPDIVTTKNMSDREQLLRELRDSFLLKDILTIERIKQPHLILDLLQAVALQIGQEASYEELATLLGLHKQTIKKYLNLCEEIFLLTSLRPYTTNQRQSIRKKRKYYFLDLGLRNALINNFNPLDLRGDVGALWENFCVIERMKHNAQLRRQPNYYFWRSYTGQEIDLIEEAGGTLSGFEMKYKKDVLPTAIHHAFADIGGRTLTLVNKENLFSTLLVS